MPAVIKQERAVNTYGHVIDAREAVDHIVSQQGSRETACRKSGHPGGTILYLAHRGLEEITMDREVMFLRDSFIPTYARLIYNGFWYAPEREMLQAAITDSQKFVTGEVRVKLFKGACHVTGRRSPFSLYDDNLSTFEKDDVYDHKDAAGFIKLNALRLRVLARSAQKRY